MIIFLNGTVLRYRSKFFKQTGPRILLHGHIWKFRPLIDIRRPRYVYEADRWGVHPASSCRWVILRGKARDIPFPTPLHTNQWITIDIFIRFCRLTFCLLLLLSCCIVEKGLCSNNQCGECLVMYWNKLTIILYLRFQKLAKMLPSDFFVILLWFVRLSSYDLVNSVTPAGNLSWGISFLSCPTNNLFHHVSIR